MVRFSLSVVLPNHNHSHLLPRAVQALLAQRRQPDEIIIIDDGSTDSSLSVIETIAAGAPSVRVLINEINQGAIPTLQRGLDAASGHFVYFAAADDWVLPDFFRKATEALEANPAVGLFCGETVLIDGRTNCPFGVRPATRPVQRARAVGPAEIRRLLRHSDNWILTGSSVFRRECVLRAGGFDVTLGSFADGLMGRKIALTEGLFYCPEIVAVWAIFTDSYSRSTALNADRARQALETIPARLSGDPAFPEWYPQLFERRWRFATARLALDAKPPHCGLIQAMAVRGKFDQATLQMIGWLPSKRVARLATLSWLWLRFRPTSLVRLVRTALIFRMMQFRKNSGSASGYAPLDPASRGPLSQL